MAGTERQRLNGFDAGTRLPFIQYLISLALVEAIEAQAASLLGSCPAGT